MTEFQSTSNFFDEEIKKSIDKFLVYGIIWKKGVVLIMKKKIFSLFLIIIFMISANGCVFGYSTPFDGKPDGIMVFLRDSNEKYLYAYGGYAHYMDESKIPLLSREKEYILDVDLRGGPFGVDSSAVNFVYEEEKLEIIELEKPGNYSLTILEDFEETTIVVKYETYNQSFSCDVLLKMQPNEIIE